LSRLAGIFPPLTTPFDAAGNIDSGALERNLEHYETVGLGGYLVFGSNGEAVHLDEDERRRVLEIVRGATAKTVIAGVNALATREAILQTRQAADAGADAVLVITPYFYRGAMTQEVLREFFVEVADVSSLPVLIYNVPQNTGVTLRPATIAGLAGHERIAGVKDSSGDFSALGETLRLVPHDFRVLVGHAGILYPGLCAGAAGAVLAVACVAPEICVELVQTVARADHDRARELQNRVAPLARMVTIELGVGGLKAAMDLRGLAGGRPRSPLKAPGAEDRERLAAALRVI